MVLSTRHVTSLQVAPLGPSGNLRGIQVRAGYAGLENRVSVSFSPPPDLGGRIAIWGWVLAVGLSTEVQRPSVKVRRLAGM